MLQSITKCANCGAGPKFIKTTKEPVSNNIIVYCGQCHKVQGSSAEGVEFTEPVKHLQKFAMAMAGMFVQTTGTEVIAHTFTEGLKMGVQMALGVPNSDKELYWMEKYGVAREELKKALEREVADLNDLIKVASDHGKDPSKDQKHLQDVIAKLAEIHKEENPGIRKQ